MRLERVKFDRERLARLEWGYLPAFEFESTPPTLSGFLADSPEFFVDVVSLVFRPANEEEGDDEDVTAENGDIEEADAAEDLDEQRQAIAANVHRLLSEWRTVPGRDGDAIDPDVSRAWAEEARGRLKEARRLRIGDTYIGKALATSAPDPDGGWPPRAVRDLLEVVDVEQLLDGLETQIANSLGTTSRGVLDGGDQERDKAAVYREHADPPRRSSAWGATTTPRPSARVPGSTDRYPIRLTSLC